MAHDIQKYRLFGLTISTKMNLDLPLADDSHSIDATIQYGSVPEHLSVITERDNVYEANEQRLLFKVGCANFLIEHGERITIDPKQEDERDIYLFLFGSVISALLHQRDLLPIHASAVQFSQGVVLFAGASGMGKSSLVAAFQRLGYPIITDDLSVLHFENDTPYIAQGYPGIHLDQKTLEEMGYSTQQLNRLGEYDGAKYIIPTTYPTNSDNNRVMTIYVLMWGKKNTVQVVPVKGMRKNQLLRLHTYRPKFIIGNARRIAYYQRIIWMANNIPIYRLVRQISRETPESVALEIASHIAK